MTTPRSTDKITFTKDARYDHWTCDQVPGITLASFYDWKQREVFTFSDHSAHGGKHFRTLRGAKQAGRLRAQEYLQSERDLAVYYAQRAAKAVTL